MAATTPALGPPPRFLIGNLSEFNRDQLGSMMRWSRDYGAVVPLRFGPLPAYLVTDPALVEQVLVDQHRSFTKTAAVRPLGPVVGRGILRSDGELWRRQRRLVQPA
jgi:cytochrome P450